MSNEDGSVWVVFNGEIYNHLAVRRELIGRGHQFRTVSDTEAIVHAYEEYGTACPERLEGMFAFAIWDRRRRELLLARDRLGKKPLFYAVLGGILHFASEIKAFYPSPAWDDSLDLSGLEGYFSLGYFLAPNTIYRHVRKLEPGHWLRLHHGQLEIRKYWDIQLFGDDRRALPMVQAEVESVLKAAVHARLESEVPLGAFLSGGIDSSLVVSHMADAIPEGVLTTSVGFAERAHNELAAAALTADRCRSRHHPVVVGPRLEEVFDPIVSAFDEPFADSSAIPAYYVSAVARQRVTVALSGDGGDETFGGYDFRYVPHAVECATRKFLPSGARRRLLGRLGASWPRWRRLPRPLRLGTVLENVGHDAAAAYYADLCFLKPGDTRALLGRPPSRDPLDSPVYEAVTRPYRRCPSSSAIMRAQYADLKVYLPNDVLVKVDRMSMLHSLEVRCPLLDHRLVELAFRIPTATKMPRLQAKYILRQMARERLPEALLRLPKHGFTAPIGEWIAGRYAGTFMDEVLQPTSNINALIDRAQVWKWFQEHRAGQRDHSFALWAVWVFERWHRARQARVSSKVLPAAGAAVVC